MCVSIYIYIYIHICIYIYTFLLKSNFTEIPDKEQKLHFTERLLHRNFVISMKKIKSLKLDKKYRCACPDPKLDDQDW